MNRILLGAAIGFLSFAGCARADVVGPIVAFNGPGPAGCANGQSNIGTDTAPIYVDWVMYDGAQVGATKVTQFDANFQLASAGAFQGQVGLPMTVHTGTEPAHTDGSVLCSSTGAAYAVKIQVGTFH